MDIWVWPNPSNSKNVYRALAKFGAPLDSITPEDFEQEGIVFQVGVPPNRFDIITTADGVNFKACFVKAMKLNVEGIIYLSSQN